MNIIVKNYVNEFIYVFIVATLSLSVIFGAFEMIGGIDRLLNGGASIIDIFLYWFYISPKDTYYIIPMSSLLCVMFVFGRAAKDLELVVIKSIGGGIKRLFAPFILIGVVIAIMNFLIGEFISAPLIQKAHDLRHKIIYKTERDMFKTDDVWLKGEKGAIIHAKIYLPNEGILKNISIYKVRDNNFSEIIEAKSCIWCGSKWILHDVKRYNMEDSTQVELQELVFDGLRSPKIYNERELVPDEMSFSALYKYFQVLKATGYNNQKIIVDLFAKISYPLTSFFTLLLGIAISTGRHRGGGLVNIGIAVFIGLVYWFAYTMSLSLGYSGIAHPMIAAWTVPACLGGLSIYGYYKIPE
ncbi:MAG: LptF/LptG family permease [Nitrospirae bacterium]|nr:LptF/LptG family permease [Nitrospirota bacterium]